MPFAAGLILGLGACILGTDGPGATPSPAAGVRVDFDRDVRPIFAASCVGCHGPKKQKGGLALHRKAAAFAGGDDGPAIVPGKGDASRLVRYVAGLDEDHPMPPDGAGEPLTPDQVGLIRAWIDQGAAWGDESKEAAETSDHWAFRRPARPGPPAVADGSWPRNPIDRFVLARLERDGLRPSPEADRATLIRRLGLDLVGLPPTIAEVDAFVADDRPDAYDRLVSRLLDSPQYGERWARRWLDGARYADTNGYEKDRERSIWPYRDWVIRALNDDMPFDRFTVEQIAGDLLPGATPAQKVATGFHRNTMINEEGGIDVEEFRFASLVDRVATTGAVWLGLTVQCAQCHTHKYDPITQRDYYRFLAFFDDADEPDLELPDPAITARRAAIGREIEGLEAGLADRFPDVDARIDWAILRPDRASTAALSPAAVRADGSVVIAGPTAASDHYEVEAEADLSGVVAFRLEALADPALPKGGPGRAPNGNFVLTEFAATAAAVEGGERRPIALGSAEADFAQAHFAAEGAIDGKPETGWAIDDGSGHPNRDRSATFNVAGKLPAEGRARLKFRLDHDHGGQHNLGRFRISAGRRAVRDGSKSPEGRRRDRLAARRAEWESGLKLTRWATATPTVVESAKRATLTVLGDRSVLATGDKPNNDTYRVEIPADRGRITAIRVEVLPHESLPDGGPGRAPLFSVGNFFLSQFDAALATADGPAASSVVIRDASADYEEPGKPASAAIDGRTDTGWSVGGGIGKPHAIVFRPDRPIDAPPGSRLVLNLHQTYIHQTTIGRFRVSTTADPSPPVASGLPADVEDAALVPRGERTDDQARLVDRHFLAVAPELAGANAEIAALRRTLPRHPTTMVMEGRPPGRSRTTHIHRRGEFLRLGAAVEPGVPSVLPPLPGGTRADRLALARWLAAEENPLVGRVVMNRAWQAFFGRGLVATVDPDLLALDPRNERLARGPRFRVESEAIRDIALAASGLLDPTVGGPSVFPPQPDGVASLAYGQTAWPTSKGRDRFRRGLYTYIKRTAPFAAFATFDAPTSEVACVRRERSNTPLQALTLLNDPAFVEAARELGRRVVAEGPVDAGGRARLAFRLCVGRSPTAEEVAMIVDFQARQLERLRSGGLDPKTVNGGASDDPERAAWTATARAILNLDETITKE